MNNTQDKVTEEILKQIYSSEYNFKYFITLDYYYRCSDYNQVLSDNKRLRTSLRRVYKDDIKMIIFVEKHSDPTRKVYGGYHRHILITDASRSRWSEPSNIMSTLLLEIDPASVFGMYDGIQPNEDIKMKMLDKVIRGFNRSVPNGVLGLNIKPITDLNRLVSYCTKQVGQYHPPYELVDSTNSDINPAPLLTLSS